MGDPLNGRYATIKIGAVLVQNMGRWNLDIKMDEIDASAFGTVWGKQIPGMQKWTATLEGNYDPADTQGQRTLQGAALAATKIADIRLYIDSLSYWKPATDIDAQYGAYISGLSIQHDKSGLASVTFNVIGYGEIKLY